MKLLFNITIIVVLCICHSFFPQNIVLFNNDFINSKINYGSEFQISNVPDFQVNDIDGCAWQCGTSLTIDKNGNFIITWLDERNAYREYRDIYAQRYTSNGNKLGVNFIVNEQVSMLQTAPSISTDSSGNFVITWADYKNEDSDIYAQRYTHEGNRIGASFIVNDDSGSEWQSEPVISMDKRGNFVIVWGDDHRIDGPNIYAQRYSRDGIAIDSNFKVNDEYIGDYSYPGPPLPSISMDNSGNFVITWTERSSGDYDIIAQLYSSNGTALGSNFKVNVESDSTYNSSPSISSDNSGNFIITWSKSSENIYDIYGQRYSSDGTPLGGNFKVNEDKNGRILSLDNYYSNSSISIDSSGNFIITWAGENNGDADIFAQRFTSDGEKLGGNFRVTNTSDCTQNTPSVKLWNGRIYTTWTDFRGSGIGSDIWANILDWDSPVSIYNEHIKEIPADYKLLQNYPNPFNPSTKIKYSIPKLNNVTLKAFDVLGSEVATLVNKELPQGNYEVEFNGSKLTSGIYFYRLQAGDYVETKKMILLK